MTTNREDASTVMEEVEKNIVLLMVKNLILKLNIPLTIKTVLLKDGAKFHLFSILDSNYFLISHF
jgi:hypothetical protein